MSKILLIDDNADNLTSLSATLKDLIHTSTILTAKSGPEGLKIASLEMPDVIILDIRMPGMDGYEVLGLLKANVKTKVIPVILLTANYTDIQSKVRGLEAGADAFLSKPIDKNELIAQVKVMQRIKKAEDMLRNENILLESVAKDASMKFDFSQKKYQNVFDNNIVGIVETTFDGKIINCNTALAKMFGFKNIEEVLEHKTIPFYKHISDREKIISFIKKNNELINYEIELVDKNGKTINTLIRCFNINNQSILSFLIDITDIKRLQEKQHQYEHIVSSSTDIMALLDKNFTYLASNTAHLEALGKTSEEIIGHTVEELFGKEFFEEVIKPYALRCLSGEVINYQEWMDLPIRGKCYWDVSYFPYKDKQNKIKGFVVNARDITVRKQAEEKLLKSEYFLSEAQRIAHIGSYELDVATGSWTSSDELYQIFGIDQNYNKNIETWKNILHPEDKEAIFAYLQNDVLTAHQTFNREYRIIRVSDNEERWVHGLGELEFDTNGNPVKMIGTIQDITERKQAEERIARFSRIFEDSLNEIYLFESDTLKFIQVNKAAQNNLGYTMAELKELTPLDLKPEFTTELFTNLIAPLRKGEKENIVFETVHKRKDQSLYNVEIHLQLLEFEHEAFFAAIILDITERKKNEEKITQKNKQLLLLSKASTEINKVLDIKIILQQLVKIAIELTGSTSGVAALYEDDKMVFTTYNNKGKIIPIDFKFEKGFGVPGWIIKTKKPYITNDAKNDKYVIQKIRERLNFHQLIDIPILNKKGELLGCFEIFNTIDKRPYNEQDIEIMQGLSASAAVAIENAQIILERKKTEMALKTSNEFNESLIETIPFGLDIVDLEGNVLFMNNLLKDTVGIENPKGKCWEFYKDSGKQCTECPLKDEMELGETNIYEIHNVFGGREYEITYTVMNYKNQKAMLEIFRDITESKKAQKEILKLSRGIEQTPAMVVITDTDGNIEFINPKVTEFTGYSKEELIGKNPKIFQSGQTPQKTYKELWDTIIKGDTWEGEILNKRKNGELYWESVRISPIFNDEGELINFLGIKVDITENIKARDELLAAKEKAEETNKLKSNFLANMSHELRTPMVGIIGFIEILEEEIKKPKLKEYASFVHEASSRLMETLNLILNLTKIEAEKINIELSKIDVIQNMKRAIKTFDKIAAKKNIYLRFESDIKKFETETDERIFDQIISNLVNNAVKYTKRGGVTVSVNKIKNDTYLEIKVKDTGIGIPKDKQELIWEDFRQVSEGMARLYEGTGLGLTITNNFVNKLGGEIKLESGLSKGSTFTVLLPVRAKSISTKTKEQTSNKKTGTPKTKNKQEKLKTLLYFEDDKISLEAIPLFLKGRYNIECAKKDEAGIEKARNKIYDGILMDIDLHTRMDGVQAAEKIKEMEEYKGVPIIAVTTNAMVGDRDQFLETGFTDYISKPFSKNDIIELLNKTIKEKN